MPPPSIYGERREPTVNFTWQEFLEANGIVTFNGALLPGKTEVFESFTDTRDSEQVLNDDAKWAAQTFTVGNTGTDADFYPTKIWADVPNGADMKLQIEETTAGVPNGTVLAKFKNTSTAVSIGGSSPLWREWDIADSDTPNLKLSSATKYALVWMREGAGSENIGFDSSGTYGGGAKYDSINSGTDWAEDVGADCLFQVIGSTKNPYILTSIGSITSSKSTTVVLATANASQFTELFNVSFEGKINKSAIIKGDAIVNFTLAKGADIEESLAVIELYHVRAGVETKIGEAEAWTSDTATGVEMELTQTTVKNGDTIKLKFILSYIETAIGVASTITISHSGSNLKLQLPFKTDLI